MLLHSTVMPPYCAPNKIECCLPHKHYIHITNENVSHSDSHNVTVVTVMVVTFLLKSALKIMSGHASDKLHVMKLSDIKDIFFDHFVFLEIQILCAKNTCYGCDTKQFISSTNTRLDYCFGQNYSLTSFCLSDNVLERGNALLLWG